MSDKENKKTGAEKEVTIKIGAKLLKRLESQIKLLKEIGVPEFENIHNVEDLIYFYVEQLALSEPKLKEIHKKIDDVMNIFAEKGVNMKNIFNNFTFDVNTWTALNDEDEEENNDGKDENDDGWDTVPEEDK
ncbi:cytochrome P450 [Candidatus Mycoplasma haematohominis]|uniref:Uncharacterized protein n=1 Tax=Candidatus Mycoplasma haematohominis TaxID=1494318 RepID=A0A478FSH7_9MOLU|nr:cytochrome P450 [Candidatus Mycoplasma haemohominis]GCE63419.1 hypothetical protein MHSWG343_04160 [Candidatus Mycoplasma haemohominis]